MKEIIKRRLAGGIITALLLASEVIFIWLLASTALFTTKLLIFCGVLLLAAAVGVYFLTTDFGHWIRSVVGCTVAAVIFIVECFGGYCILKGANTLSEIATPKREIAEIGIYVRADDPATAVAHIPDYSIGILKDLDRKNTDAALSNLSERLGKAPATTEYEGIEELLDSLLEETTDAILLNNAFLELFEESEDYEFYLHRIRLLYTLRVEDNNQDISTENILPKDSNSFTLYITGIDTRSSKIWKKSRSDVNILATVNTKTGQIVLISTPRDYYVPLSISNGIEDKLTHSGIYGTQVSIDTMEMLYGIQIDYYFKVNFTGFKDIIDALGGITVYSDVNFSSGGYSFKKGSNEVNGTAALAFARERMSIGGDRHRGIHQLAVVQGVINKATSPALLKNYTEILDGVKGSFETSMPYDEIAKLVRQQLDKGTQWNIVSYAVNGQGATKKVYSLSQKAYVMIPDKDTVAEATRLMEQVKKGETPVVN